MRGRFPTCSFGKQLQQPVADEPRLRDLVSERGLTAALRLPFKKKSRGFLELQGVGTRRAGGGCKSNFANMWHQGKVWHSCERLVGVQIGTQDMWWTFRDAASLELKLLQPLKFWMRIAPEEAKQLALNHDTHDEKTEGIVTAWLIPGRIGGWRKRRDTYFMSEHPWRKRSPIAGFRGGVSAIVVVDAVKCIDAGGQQWANSSGAILNRETVTPHCMASATSMDGS